MKQYAVLGGGSGIGQSLTRLLLEEGNHVYASYRSSKIEPQERSTVFQWDALKEELDPSVFPDTLDGLVYCPGSISLKPFARFTLEDFLEDYKLQVLGAVQAIQSLSKNLKKSGNASVVLFSTVAVQKGLPYHSLVSSSKGAVEGLTRALAAELSPKIRVNAIAPSLTDTPLAASLLDSDKKRDFHAGKNPSKRVATANEVAEAAKWLLSEKSSYVTGQVLAVDGGLSSLSV
jgi:NAD(P)-dependent dehydrogenase (short-subunit alcohol dehydrogenase family)